MPLINIGQWAPDASDYGNPGAIVCKNAFPGVNSYLPWPRLSITTDTLTARPRGAIEVVDSAGNNYQYAGDASKIYSLVSASWTDVSLGGGYTTGTNERWEFARWNQQVIATNYSNNPQVITMGGANYANLTTALRFRHLAIVRDFVVAGNTFDGTDGAVPDRVWWSAQGDATDWTPSTLTLSDFRDLAVGDIQAIVGGDFGVIVCKDSTFRMTFVGTPKVFQIDEVAPNIGAVAPGGVVRMGSDAFFPAEHGFVRIAGGQQHEFIGAGRVDQFFLNDLDRDYLDRVSATSDPKSSRVFWAYPGAGNTAGRPNKIIMYDHALDKWGYGEIDTELLWRAGGVGYTLEGLDAISTNIDAMTESLDSNTYKGSSTLLAGFDSTFASGNFTGSPYTAVFETRESRFNDGQKSKLKAFEAVVDGGSVTARVGYRDNQSEAVTYTPTLSPQPTGLFSKRVNAAFHRFELTVAGTWNDAIGVNVDPARVRPGGRRG